MHLSTVLDSKLSTLAAEYGRDKEALIREAIEAYLNSDEWFREKIEEGLAAADRGQLLEHEEVKALIDRRYPG